MPDKPRVLPDLTNQDPILISLKSEYLIACDRQRKRKEVYGEDHEYRYYEICKKDILRQIQARIDKNARDAAVFYPEADPKVVEDYIRRRDEVFASNKNLPVVFNPPPKVLKDRDRTDLTTPIKSRVVYKQKRKHPADDPPPYDNAIKYRGKTTSDPRWRNFRKRPKEDE